jgi:hypothetical protein
MRRRIQNTQLSMKEGNHDIRADLFVPPENREAVVARYKETGGGLPPAGVNLLSRWHVIGGGRGGLVAESDDPPALAKWVHQWSDVTSFEVCPVMKDEVLAKLIE